MPKRIEIIKIEGSDQIIKKREIADWLIKLDGKTYLILYSTKEGTAVSCAKNIEDGIRSKGGSCWIN